MATKRNTGLGRGLESIFEQNALPESQGVILLNLSEIEPRPDQPRKVFDPEQLASLADSIAANGLIQPLVVRRVDGSDFYQIIAGERRWRASKMAGLTEVPVRIIEADDRRASEISIIENIQRSDLNPVEEASAIKALIEGYGLTQEEVSRQIGRSRTAVTNSLRLLDLPADVMAMLASGQLSVGHAKVLLGLPPEKISEVAQRIVREGLSVRAAEGRVHTVLSTAKAKKAEALPQVDYMARLETRVTHALGRRVRIRRTGGARRIEIAYQSNDDLEELIEKLCGKAFFEQE